MWQERKEKKPQCDRMGPADIGTGCASAKPTCQIMTLEHLPSGQNPVPQLTNPFEVFFFYLQNRAQQPSCLGCLGEFQLTST